MCDSRKNNMEKRTSQNEKDDLHASTTTVEFRIRKEKVVLRTLNLTLTTVIITKNRWFFCVQNCKAQQLSINCSFVSEKLENDNSSRKLKISNIRLMFLSTQSSCPTRASQSQIVICFKKPIKQRKMSRQVLKPTKFAAHAEIQQEAPPERKNIEFNYSIEEIAKHRIGRTIKSDRVWI